MNAPDGFSVFASLHAQRREERQMRELQHDPAALAGRALGVNGSLTLEHLICDPDLGALTASPPQLALIRAMDGCAIAESILSPDRMLYHFGTEQLIWDGERLPSGRPRLVVLRTGVRAGKTLISVLALLHSVLTCHFRRKLTDEEIKLGVKPSADGMVGVRPGELVRAVVVAPKLKLARSPFQHLVGTMEASPKLKKLFAEKPNKESCLIKRPDGQNVLIELVAADVGGAGLRSTWLAGAMFDEADFHDAEDAAVNLKDNIDACRMRMLKGARILVPSSPWAEGSPFDKMFSDIFKNNMSDGELAFHSDSLSMNPTLDRKEIEREYRKDEDSASREYGAIPFGAGAEKFYPSDAITKSFIESDWHHASDNGRRIEVHEPDDHYPHVAASDWGFRKNSSALAISRAKHGKVELVFRLELRPARDESLKPSRVVQEFAFWAMRYRCPAILGDMHSIDSTIEELAKLDAALKNPNNADAEQRAWVERVRSDPFARDASVPGYLQWPSEHCVHRDNDAAHTEMKRRMQEGLVVLPADDRMMQQCRDTKRRASSGGHMKILLPKHGAAHGDLWGAVVIACSEISLEQAMIGTEPPPPPLDYRSVGRGFR